MPDQDQPLDYYEILGVSFDASDDEIRRAYRRLSMEWHPDRNEDTNAPRMMRLINEAWDVLGKPERRAEYDRDYFLLRSVIAEAARREHEKERQEREWQQEQQRRETEERLRRAEAVRRAQEQERLERERQEQERKRQQEEREAKERRVREEHEQRERERHSADPQYQRAESRQFDGTTASTTEHQRGRNPIATFAVVLAIFVGIILVAVWLNLDDEPTTSETVRSSVIATRTPRPSPPPPRPTATPVPRVAAAHAAKPTSSPVIKPTATRTPKPTPTRIPPSAPTRTSVPTQPRNIETSIAYGPRSGTLTNSSDSGWWFDSNTKFGDFLAEVVFTIPHTIIGDYWIGGIIIRANGSEADLVGIVSNGDWLHSRQNDAGWETLTQGYSPAINTTPGGTNRVQVAASSKTGWLSINGGSPIELALDGAAQSGTVVLASYADSGTSLTSFSGFTVRPVNAGQESTNVLATTPSPASKATAVPTPTATKSALAQPTVIPKPTWTGSNTVLHELLYRGDATPQQLRVLIDAGAPLNTTDGYGDTPLEVAVQRGHSDETIRIIIEAGADLSKAERVLHDLLYRSDATTHRLKVLIDAGAPLNTTDGYGDTPLEVAVQRGHSDETIRIIIEAGADLSKAERVLHALLYRSDATSHRLKVLIDAGAPLNTTDGYGDTPLEVAVQRGHSDETIRIIIEAGADLSKAERVLHALLYRSDATSHRLKVLIDAGALLNTTDGYGDSPLEVAVQRGHSEEIIRTIIEAMNR